MNHKPLIVDGHLDLSMNALEWNRDLRWTVEEIRQSEVGMTDKPDRAKGTVSFGAMRDGNIGICIATLIARYVKKGNPIPGWHSPEQAWAQTQGQLAWYKAMEESGELFQISSAADLRKHLNLWNSGKTNKIGYLLSLEGSDSLVTISHLERAYDYGLRAIGPAHYGPGTYAQGTNAKGGLGEKGRTLLKEIERLGMILDVTHLGVDSFIEAVELFHGPLWASHNNCQVFAPHTRQFSDEQVRLLIERDALIGVALDAWMLVPDWVSGKSDPVSMNVSLKNVIDNIDHICQLAGNSLHAAIGSDLDGAFGTEQSPYDIDTIADLQKVPVMLKEKGYNKTDIENILHANWIRFLEKNLP